MTVPLNVLGLIVVLALPDKHPGDAVGGARDKEFRSGNMATNQQNTQPKGIGGWLVLPAIALIISPLLRVTQLKSLLPTLHPETWAALTTPGSMAYHPLWAPLLIYEVVVNIAIFGFTLWLLILFFKKSHLVPKLYIAWLLTITASLIIDELLARQIPFLASQVDAESFKELVRSIFASMIWIPYFLKSERVKNTFCDEIIELTDTVIEINNDQPYPQTNHLPPKMGFARFRILAISIGFIMIFAAVVVFAYKSSVATWPEIIKRTKVSVVTIKTADGFGSGFLASSDGLIITNAHVVSNNSGAEMGRYIFEDAALAPTVEVTFQNGMTKTASVIKQGTPPLDIAILKVDGTYINWLPLSNDACEEGAEIVAIGTPKGYVDTITKGIISHCNRDVRGVKHLQTDTSINSGSSGGPVINKKGEVVGISTIKLSGVGVEGLNFLISGETISSFREGKLDSLAALLQEEENERIQKAKIERIQLEQDLKELFNLLWTVLTKEDLDYIDRLNMLVADNSIAYQDAVYALQVKRNPPQGFTSREEWIRTLLLRVVRNEITWDEAITFIKGHFR